MTGHRPEMNRFLSQGGVVVAMRALRSGTQVISSKAIGF
jgi:hypothetical protein